MWTAKLLSSSVHVITLILKVLANLLSCFYLFQMHVYLFACMWTNQMISCLHRNYFRIHFSLWNRLRIKFFFWNMRKCRRTAIWMSDFVDGILYFIKIRYEVNNLEHIDIFDIFIIYKIILTNFNLEEYESLTFSLSLIHLFNIIYWICIVSNNFCRTNLWCFIIYTYTLINF